MRQTDVGTALKIISASWHAYPPRITAPGTQADLLMSSLVTA